MEASNLGVFPENKRENDAAHHSSRLNQLDRFAYGWQSQWSKERSMSNPYLDSSQPHI